MLSIYPVFFPYFKCKADACSHTCCQIWEIDIDPEAKKGLLAKNWPSGCRRVNTGPPVSN